VSAPGALSQPFNPRLYILRIDLIEPTIRGEELDRETQPLLRSTQPSRGYAASLCFRDEMGRREWSQFRRLRLRDACCSAVLMYTLGQELAYSVCQHFLSREPIARSPSTIGLHRLGTTAALKTS
jgi:hypothetical protein